MELNFHNSVAARHNDVASDTVAKHPSLEEGGEQAGGNNSGTIAEVGKVCGGSSSGRGR